MGRLVTNQISGRQIGFSTGSLSLAHFYSTNFAIRPLALRRSGSTGDPHKICIVSLERADRCRERPTTQSGKGRVLTQAPFLSGSVRLYFSIPWQLKVFQQKIPEIQGRFTKLALSFSNNLYLSSRASSSQRKCL